jgi:hypothetical protein
MRRLDPAATRIAAHIALGELPPIWVEYLANIGCGKCEFFNTRMSFDTGSQSVADSIYLMLA